MSVPFLELSAVEPEVRAAVAAAVAEVLASQRFALGPHLERFEAAMAAYCGIPHAIGVGSGTDALVLALTALGVGSGARVLTTPFSFFATASTIARVGGRPVVADVARDTLNLDPQAVRAVLERDGAGIVGIVPVDLFGRLAPMAELRAVAERYGLWLLEDAAQAIGATRDGVHAGTFGRVGVLSFYPTKNLGGIGDGGMVLTADDALATRVRRERNHGQVGPYLHDSIGFCSRLDGIQAAALHAKLSFLDGWNARRRTVAEWYARHLRRRGLAGDPEAPLVLPEPAGTEHVFHVYSVRARDRDALGAHLAAAGIGTQVYYRTPLHRQPALSGVVDVPLGVPEAERAAGEVLALPMYPQLDEDRVARVAEAIAAFYRGGGGPAARIVGRMGPG